ncbi:hypothetical protein D3C85_1479120 [compost metagenome]
MRHDAAGQQLRAVALRVQHLRVQRLAQVGTGQRRQRGGGVGRMAGHQRADVFQEGGDKIIGDLRHHDHALGGVAALAGVAEA